MAGSKGREFRVQSERTVESCELIIEDSKPEDPKGRRVSSQSLTLNSKLLLGSWIQAPFSRGQFYLTASVRVRTPFATSPLMWNRMTRLPASMRA